MAFIDPGGITPLLGSTPMQPQPVNNAWATPLPNATGNEQGPTPLPNANASNSGAIIPIGYTGGGYTGTQLTPEQAAQLASQAGFSGQGLVNIVAIMGRESGYSPTAYNGNSQTGDSSVGLTQINLYGNLAQSRIALLNSILPPGQQVSNVQQAIAALQIPAINLKMAYLISGNGQDFSPWKVDGNDPTSFLKDTNVAQAQAAVQAIGGGGESTADLASAGGGRFGASINDINSILQGMPSGSPVSGGDGAGNQTWTQFQQTLQQYQQLLQSMQQGGVNNPNFGSYAIALNGLGQILSSEAGVLQNEGPSAQWRNWLGGLQQNLSTFQAQAAAQSSAASAYNNAQQNVTSRANLALTAQEDAMPWGTTNGKTSFTAADLGLDNSFASRLLGIQPNQTLVNYPGVTTFNPLLTANTIANAQGVGGAMPLIGTNPNAQGQAGNAFANGMPGGALGAPNTGSGGAQPGATPSPNWGGVPYAPGQGPNTTASGGLIPSSNWGGIPYAPGQGPPASPIVSPQPPGLSTLLGPNPGNSPFLPGYVAPAINIGGAPLIGGAGLVH